MPDQNSGAERCQYPPASIPPIRLSGDYYSTADAVLLLGVSKQRVTTYLDEGRLTGVMVGNRWLIVADSVERLIEMRERGELRDMLTERRPAKPTAANAEREEARA